LLYYGFIESGTKFHRSVELGIDEETTPKAQSKLALLKNWGHTFSFDLCSDMEEENLHRLVQWARFCVFEGVKDDELTKSIKVVELCQSYEDTFNLRMVPQGQEHETKAWQLIIATLEGYLSKYHTSFDKAKGPNQA
jgi:hypothetical protein